jgi:D-alanine-D-alanine ligase-like ATP-grasp enzyme
MAKDHLDATFKAQVDFSTQMMAALMSANKAALDELQKLSPESYVAAFREANKIALEELQKLTPKAYTFDEVVKKANELYSFVLKKE